MDMSESFGSNVIWTN